MKQLDFIAMGTGEAPISADQYTRYRTCPVCGGAHYEVIESQRNLQFFADEPGVEKRVSYNQVLCRSCQTLYMNPVYTDRGFEILFSMAGRSYGDGGGRHGEQIAWLAHNDCLFDGAVIVDIGCYDGSFLRALPNQGRFIGVDFDQGAIDRARAACPSDHFAFIQGRFEAFVLEEKADVFTMFHVLEHLPEPVETLRQLRRNGHEKTRLIVEVPVLETAPTNDIHGFYSPQHLTHFSHHSLAQTLRKGGWKMTAYEAADGYNGFRCMAVADDGDDFVATGHVDDVALVRRERAHLGGALAAVEERLATLPDTDNIIIWGGGMHTEYLYQRTTLFQRLDGRDMIIVDSDPTKQGHRWRGIPILAPNVVWAADWSSTTLVISSYGGQEKIKQAALDAAVPRDAIFTVYDHVISY